MSRQITRRMHERLLRLCFFQAEDGIRDLTVTGVQTCALPISGAAGRERLRTGGRGERDLHVVSGPDRRVPGARRAPARLARRAPARRRRGRGVGRAAALHPRAAALLYHEAPAPAETYVPA